jgi:hypothetical protein
MEKKCLTDHLVQLLYEVLLEGLLKETYSLESPSYKVTPTQGQLSY